MIFRNIAVPIDGSPLARTTVEQAVAYARDSGAKITFLHVCSDYASSEDGALLRSVAPEVFNEVAAGTARGIMAKAQASARAAGVESHSLIVTSDATTDSILTAAHDRQCDLIFVSSRGRRGVKRMVRGSFVEQLMRRTDVPILIAAVESNRVQSAEDQAIGIIKDEHRSLAAILHALGSVLDNPNNQNGHNLKLVGAMLGYLEQFPERLHHPKEDRYLFSRLKARTDQCNSLLDELEAQHISGAEQGAVLKEAFTRWEQGETEAADAFRLHFQEFAQAQIAHMKLEETLLLPAASEYLTSEDWTEIAMAFGENGDPCFHDDEQASLEALFTKLLNLAVLKQ